MTAESQVPETFVACIEAWNENPALSKVAQIDHLTANLPLFPPERIEDYGVAAAMQIEKSPESATEIVLQLTASPTAQSRAIGMVILSRLAIYAPTLWANLVKHMLMDSDWEVRRFAQRVFDSSARAEGVAEFHLEFVVETIQEWTRDKEYLVRYGATQALLGYVKKHPEFGERLLGLLDPLYDDASEYVRDGAAAAMRAVGKTRPELVFSFIELKLDQLKDLERETYLTTLDHPFADKRPEWKEKILAALNSPVAGSSK